MAHKDRGIALSLDDILQDYPELDFFDIDELDDLDELELQDLIDEFETDFTLSIALRNDVQKIRFSDSSKQEIKEKYNISEREYLRAENLSIKSQLADNAARESSNSGIKALNKGTVSVAELVIFATREDDKVCPICEALNGEIYGVDTDTKIIDGPLIPDDTHPNCRCRYLIFGTFLN
jgi:hypothetical protein